MITCLSESTLKSTLIDDDDGPERSIKRKRNCKRIIQTINKYISNRNDDLPYIHGSNIKIRTGDFDEFIQ